MTDLDSRRRLTPHLNTPCASQTSCRLSALIPLLKRLPFSVRTVEFTRPNMSDRYLLVSSFYGPGSVGCWLFTVASVVIAWTLNRRHRVKDTITNDLLATLTYPVVAAGHLLLQVRDFPGDRAAIMTDGVFTQYTASIEASLNVCEIFATMSLALFSACALAHTWKRAALVALAGTLCFVAEVFLSTQGPTVVAGNSTFQRPFLLNLPGAVMANIIALSLLFIALAGVGAVFLLFGTFYAVCFEGVRLGTFLVSAFMIPLSMINGFGVLGSTTITTAEKHGWALWHFFPASGVSITELDQAVALGAGVIVFIFSLYEALKILLSAGDRGRDQNSELDIELGE